MEGGREGGEGGTARPPTRQTDRPERQKNASYTMYNVDAMQKRIHMSGCVSQASAAWSPVVEALTSAAQDLEL